MFLHTCVPVQYVEIDLSCQAPLGTSYMKLVPWIVVIASACGTHVYFLSV
jgi:hypothetical protein